MTQIELILTGKKNDKNNFNFMIREPINYWYCVETE